MKLFAAAIQEATALSAETDKEAKAGAVDDCVEKLKKQLGEAGVEEADRAQVDSRLLLLRRQLEHHFGITPFEHNHEKKPVEDGPGEAGPEPAPTDGSQTAINV